MIFFLKHSFINNVFYFFISTLLKGRLANDWKKIKRIDFQKIAIRINHSVEKVPVLSIENFYLFCFFQLWNERNWKKLISRYCENLFHCSSISRVILRWNYWEFRYLNLDGAKNNFFPRTLIVGINLSFKLKNLSTFYCEHSTVI